MATSTTAAWAKGFSENPAGKRLRARSIVGMLNRVGNECEIKKNRPFPSGIGRNSASGFV